MMRIDRARARMPWIVAVCALALALAGCDAPGGAPGQPSAAATTASVATATATPAPTLPWRTVHLPVGVDLASAALVVSPVNGRVAWVCAPGANGTYAIYRTQDEAATWRQVSALHPVTKLPVTDCAPRPDQGDADGLAVVFMWGGGNSPVANNPVGSAGYYTADGGAHWTRTPDNQFVQQVTTAGATTYALALDLTTPNNTTSLVASADHLASWRVLAPPAGRPTANVEVWVGHYANELIWDEPNSGEVFHSTDGAASWLRIPAPAGQTFQPTVATWRGEADWLICGFVNIPTATPGPPETRSQCSADLGKTWKVIPDLTNTWSCGNCANGGGPASGVEPCIATMIADNGALYALCGHDPQDTAGSAPQPPLILSMLAPGASAWTTIGQAPCAFGTQAILTRTGQVWLLQPNQLGPNLVLDQLP